MRRLQLLRRAPDEVSRDRYERAWGFRGSERRLDRLKVLGLEFRVIDVAKHPSGGIYLLEPNFHFGRCGSGKDDARRPCWRMTVRQRNLA
jgi:hypothetical protein